MSDVVRKMKGKKLADEIREKTPRSKNIPENHDEDDRGSPRVEKR